MRHGGGWDGPERSVAGLRRLGRTKRSAAHKSLIVLFPPFPPSSARNAPIVGGASHFGLRPTVISTLTATACCPACRRARLCVLPGLAGRRWQARRAARQTPRSAHGVRGPETPAGVRARRAGLGEGRGGSLATIERLVPLCVAGDGRSGEGLAVPGCRYLPAQGKPPVAAHVGEQNRRTTRPRAVSGPVVMVIDAPAQPQTAHPSRASALVMADAGLARRGGAMPEDRFAFCQFMRAISAAPCRRGN